MNPLSAAMDLTLSLQLAPKSFVHGILPTSSIFATNIDFPKVLVWLLRFPLVQPAT
jgi:hypothetical protein